LKRKCSAKWTIGRALQVDWVAKYPFIEPIDPGDGNDPTECKCMICFWATKKEHRMQLKLDTIQKHCGKLYYNKIDENGQTIKCCRDKTKDECNHLRYKVEYERYMKEK